MGFLVGALGVASIIAWTTTVVAVVQAFNGSSWWSAIIWAATSIVLTAARKTTQRSALVREAKTSLRTIESAGESSPSLVDALEYFDPTDYQRLGRVPPPHPTPADVGGLALMLLSWLCTVGGIVLSVIGAFQVLNGILWVIGVGVVLLILAGPLHILQRNRYASKVLAVYESEMVGPLPKNPTRELRLALWQFAQAAAPRGGNADLRVAQMIDVYTGLIAAWGEDQ